MEYLTAERQVMAAITRMDMTIAAIMRALPITACFAAAIVGVVILIKLWRR